MITNPVIVPPAPIFAVICAAVPVCPPALPTLTEIVFASTTVIAKFALPPAGSVDLG